MIQNKKAQIMSLDILFTTTLVILMFFLMFNIVEARINQSNIDKINSELTNVSNLVLLKIIDNPLVNCYASDSQNIFHIPGCISATQSQLTKKNLGVPSNYKCNLSSSTAVVTTNGCNDPFNAAIVSNYVSIDFNVSIPTNRQISKYDFIGSYRGVSNNLDTIATFNLKVWK